MVNVWTASSPGTFGELVQGKIGNRNFLVTLPISRFATASIDLVQPQIVSKNEPFDKTEKFLQVLGRYLGRPLHYEIAIESQIPRSKGLASSSADLTAVGTLVLSHLGIDPASHPDLISIAAREVEPTDGVMYRGIVAYAQHQCELMERFGCIDFEIAGILLEGEIDTVRYDSKSLKYTDEDCQHFSQAFELVKEGLRRDDLHCIGAASTISSIINQRFLPKRRFNEVMDLRTKHSCPGIVVAHSGTAIGLILDKGISDSQKDNVLCDLDNLFGLPAEIFTTWMEGPQLISCPQTDSSSARILVKGNFRKMMSRCIPDFPAAEALLNQQGLFQGFAVEANTCVSKLAQIAKVVRQYFEEVEIETTVEGNVYVSQ